jgi:hypothetical protein
MAQLDRNEIVIHGKARQELESFEKKVRKTFMCSLMI